MLSPSKSLTFRDRSIQVVQSAWGLALVALPSIAHAQTVGNPQQFSPERMIYHVCTFIVGGFGQSLATLAIVAVGLMWMFGRVSLMTVAGVVGGIVVMFGAGWLGTLLTGQAMSSGG